MTQTVRRCSCQRTRPRRARRGAAGLALRGPRSRASALKFRLTPDAVGARARQACTLRLTGPGGSSRRRSCTIHNVPLSVNTPPRCNPVNVAQRTSGLAPEPVAFNVWCCDDEHDELHAVRQRARHASYAPLTLDGDGGSVRSGTTCRRSPSGSSRPATTRSTTRASAAHRVPARKARRPVATTAPRGPGYLPRPRLSRTRPRPRAVASPARCACAPSFITSPTTPAARRSRATAGARSCRRRCGRTSLAALADEDPARATLVVAGDDRQARDLAGDLRAWLRPRPVRFYPSRGVAYESHLAPPPHLVGLRVAALDALLDEPTPRAATTRPSSSSRPSR